MPNKCTNCGKIHPDDADYLLSGCDSCGSKFFFYVTDAHIKNAQKDVEKLSKEELKEIEQDVRDILLDKKIKCGVDDTVILDFEAIRVIAPGKYEIDIVNLFNQRPIVIRVGSGKYEIDISSIVDKRLDS
ncbi:hypothetical protein GQ473_04755 [archaeon]|nr:hypothetical protein [archaeon]